MNMNVTKVFFASALLLASASIAAAQPQESMRIDPHTPVSSDGTATPRAEAGMNSKVSVRRCRASARSSMRRERWSTAPKR
jgi:hypothetical protein